MPAPPALFSNGMNSSPTAGHLPTLRNTGYCVVPNIGFSASQLATTSTALNKHTAHHFILDTPSPVRRLAFQAKRLALGRPTGEPDNSLRFSGRGSYECCHWCLAFQHCTCSVPATKWTGTDGSQVIDHKGKLVARVGLEPTPPFGQRILSFRGADPRRPESR